MILRQILFPFGCQKIGEKVPEEQLHEILSEVDLNRNAEVDLGEFLQVSSCLGFVFPADIFIYISPISFPLCFCCFAVPVMVLFVYHFLNFFFLCCICCSLSCICLYIYIVSEMFREKHNSVGQELLDILSPIIVTATL